MKSHSIAPQLVATNSLTACDRKGVSCAARNHRSRLYARLGIVPLLSSEGKRVNACSRPVRKIAPFSEPLKYDSSSEQEDELRSPERISKEGTTIIKTKSQKSRAVAFKKEVSVVLVPNHQQYSDRIRSRLWCGKQELRNMAARNTLEYESEGWRWENVLEDDEFITMASGERVHPVHFRRLFSSPFVVRQPMRVLQYQHQHQMSVHCQQQQQHFKSTVPDVENPAVCCPDSLPGGVPDELARH